MRARAGFALVAALAPAAAWAAEKVDPWTQIPPIPTTCYFGVDQYELKVDAAMRAVDAERAQQQKINDDLSSKVQALDPMEQANRLQQYLMSHPQDGLALMQEVQSAGSAAVQGVIDENDTLTRMQAEKSALLVKYDAAYKGAIGPVDAKFDDLDKRAQKDLVVVGEGYAYAPWAVKEYDGLVVERNAAYARLCRDWWAPGSQFAGWLDRLRGLLKDQVPTLERSERSAVGVQVVIIESDGASFRPVSSYTQAVQYLEQVGPLYKKRDSYPMEPMESGKPR